MNNSGISRGLILEVPYAEKNAAKSLGARWDPEMKKWFVPKGHDTKPFRKWIQKAEAVPFTSPSEDA